MHETALWPTPKHLKRWVGPRLKLRSRVSADSPSTTKYMSFRSLAASARMVTYTTIDQYAFSGSFQLSHDSLTAFMLFSFSSISITLNRTSPFSSSTASLHALSTSTVYHRPRKMRDLAALVFSAASSIQASSPSSRQVMWMRALFQGPPATGFPLLPSCITFSISRLGLPGVHHHPTCHFHVGHVP